MLVGVPKEIKTREYRVGMTPAGVRQLVARGHKVVVEKGAGDGQPAHECILGTPKYNFNWQRAYVYDEPMEKLPLVTPGDTLRFTCTYDNTIDNPYVVKALSEEHVGTPKDIHLGETTLDEMCLGALVVVRRASVLDSL